MEFEFETEIEEAEVTISFDYQPEEATVMYYSDGTGHDGCAASIDGYNVTFETKRFNSETRKNEVFQQDITDFVDKMGIDIEELCFNHIETLGE